jgi:type II secretory pathway component PulM
VNTLRQFWAGRSASERRTLSFAGAALALMLAYGGVYEPLHSAHQRLQAQVREQAIAIASAQALIAGRGPLVKMQSPDGVSSLSIVDQAVRAANLQSGMKSINPSGEAGSEQGIDGGVRLEFGGVNFEALAGVLEKLENERDMEVLELSLDAISAGTVSGKIMIARKSTISSAQNAPSAP